MPAPKKVTKKVVKKEKDLDGFCHKCYQYKDFEDFYTSKNRFSYSKNVPYCKDCTKDIFDYYLNKSKDLEPAIYFTCQKLDIPFIRRVYESFVERVKDMKNPNLVAQYFTMLSLCEKKSDTWNSFSDSDVGLGEIKNLAKHERAIEEEMKDLILVWGEYSVEDLQFLEYRFTIYTEDIDLFASQEKLFRDLCILELKQRKLNEQDEDTKNVQSQILSLMKILKIDQFEESKELSLVEKMIEYQIKEIEEKEPCEIFDKDKREEMEDFLKIREGWEEVKRCLKNLILGHKDYNIK